MTPERERYVRAQIKAILDSEAGGGKEVLWEVLWAVEAFAALDAERAAHEETRREKHEIGDVDAHHIAQLRDAVRQHYARADEVARERDTQQARAERAEAALSALRTATEASYMAQAAATQDAVRERDELRAALAGLRGKAVALYREAYGPSRAIREVTALCDALGSALDGAADLAAQVRAEARRAALLDAAEAFTHAATYDGTTVIARLRALAAKEGP